MALRPLTRLRRICLALPEAHEVETWGEPTFRVRNKIFAMASSVGTHHTQDRPAVWIKAGPGNQPMLVRVAPDRFFVPPYVGSAGWVGAWLDAEVDWTELTGLIEDAWRMTAPKRLVKAMDAGASR